MEYMSKRKKSGIIWKVVAVVGGLALLGFGVFIWKLNNREQSVKPQENEELVIEVKSPEQDPADLVDAVMKTSESEPYHGPIVPLCVYKDEELPRIVCWGDSLTEASGGQSYPDVLGTLTEAKIINYGLHSDSTRAIAVREGALPIYAGACTIPADQTPVPVKVSFSNGKSTQILRNGSVGVNPCMLGPVRGTLALSGDGYTFTRSEPGEEVSIGSGTRISTQGAMNKSKDDVVILFSGANDAISAENASDLIEHQQLILNDIGSSQYIVIGLTYTDDPKDLPAINKVMQETYKEHFLDFRDYLLQYGCADAGITPTAQDEKDIKDGIVPTSLRQDKVHGTPDFYSLLAQQVYRKLMYLGYLPLDPAYQVQDAGNHLPRVVFWGDSLTEGTNGNGVTFPLAVLEAAAEDGKEIEIRNYGVYAEQSSLIAARAGGNPMRLKQSVTIPADTTPVEIVPVSDMAGYEMLLVFGGDKELSARPAFDGDNSLNPCILAGVEGNISMNAEENKRYFTRLTPGDPVVAQAGTPFEFWAMRDRREDDILVIWNGSNDDPTPQTVQETFKYIHTIIDYTGTDKYIVLNMVKRETIPQIEEVNAAFEKEFGDHCLDIYTYLREEAMDEAGLTMTAEDKAALADCNTPESLRSDSSHYNEAGYTMIGHEVYRKLCEMGYL